MPRPIATYTAADWLRLRPLSQGYKTLLWDRIDRRYRSLMPADPAPLRVVRDRLAGNNLVISVAWNSPWTIRWQLRFVTRHLTNAAFLVADNSSDEAARAEIAEVCREAGVAWLPLPPNPYPSGHPSRSHGLALNWVYHNVVRALDPAAWGFFDHDLFPTAAFDPQQRLIGQPFYGVLETRTNGSYLWPGYCFFARGVDADEPLDFRQDWFLGLDTGGMNAARLLGRADLTRMRFASSRSIGPQRNFAVSLDEIDRFDDCVHLGNASGWLAPAAERQPALTDLLQRLLDGEISLPAA